MEEKRYFYCKSNHALANTAFTDTAMLMPTKLLFQYNIC